MSGQIVGEFRLVHLLGRGGMGEVWEAEQSSLGARRVALKFVRQDLSSGRQLELFAREARAGGRGRHPGLVTVYGSGTADGLAWIAMELVPGARTVRWLLDELSREGALPRDHDRTVARLVAEIAEAMQAAHEAGVIHRDLKPQNVLLDEDGRPKVTDFGLARLTDETALSRSDAQAGTWAYMSPEQIGARRSAIDHRTDVFSLGVVLYELLTLQRPFSGDTSHQIAAQILHQEPRDPRSVRSRIPPELVVITAKALEKEPSRRYESMGAFAEDLRRFLADRPILARPPTLADRLRKWTRRHPARAAMLAIATVAFASISIVSVHLARTKQELGRQRDVLDAQTKELSAALSDREEALGSLRERTSELQEAGLKLEESVKVATIAAEEAQASRLRAERVTELVQEALQASDPYQDGSRALTVVEAMAGVAARLRDGFLADDPDTAVALELTISRILNGNGDLEGALDLARMAVVTCRAGDTGTEDELLVALDRVASALYSLDRTKEALETYEEALETARRLRPGDDPDVCTFLTGKALCLQRLDRVAEAVPLFEEALRMARATRGDDPHGTSAILYNLSSACRAVGRLEDALAYANEALESERSTSGAQSVYVAWASAAVAASLSDLGRDAEATPLLRDALAIYRSHFEAPHPDIARALQELGGNLWLTNHLEEAIDVTRQAVEMNREIFGSEHTAVASSLENLGLLLSDAGEAEDGIATLKSAVAMYRELLDGDHSDVAHALLSLATTLKDQGNFADALPPAEEGVSMLERSSPEQATTLAWALCIQGDCLGELGRSEEAVDACRRSVELYRAAYPDGHPDVLWSLSYLVYWLESAGHLEEALARRREELSMLERTPDAPDPDVIRSLAGLGRCLLRLERRDDARSYVERACSLATELLPDDDPLRAECDDLRAAASAATSADG